MATWDEERAWSVINLAFEEISAGKKGSVDEFSCAKDLVELIADVRAQAIRWAWVEARNGYDRGMVPHQRDLTELLNKAKADLNPERDK